MCIATVVIEETSVTTVIDTQIRTVTAQDDEHAFLCGKCLEINMAWTEVTTTLQSDNPYSSIQIHEKTTKICPKCGHKQSHTVALSMRGAF